MGLAWDSAWRALISRKQAKDNAWRQCMDEANRLLKDLEMDLSVPIPRVEVCTWTGR